MSKHTATPYSLGGKYKFKTVLLNANGESIASGGNNRAVVGEELEATLAHIVRCVNSHDALVELLSALLATRSKHFIANDVDGMHGWDERAEAALAAAKGGA